MPVSPQKFRYIEKQLNSSLFKNAIVLHDSIYPEFGGHTRELILKLGVSLTIMTEDYDEETDINSNFNTTTQLEMTLKRVLKESAPETEAQVRVS